MFSGTLRDVECHLGAEIEDVTHYDAVLLQYYLANPMTR